MPRVYPHANVGSVVHLLSGGGIDSAVLAHFYRARGSGIRAYHFAYGQPSLRGERRAVRALGRYFQMPTTFVELGYRLVSRAGEFSCRNALFALVVAGTLPTLSARIALGIHSGTEYFDCSPAFLSDLQRLLDGYFGGGIRVEAPLIDYDRATIASYFREASIPRRITFSCERRSDRHCGRCLSCRDRRLLG